MRTLNPANSLEKLEFKQYDRRIMELLTFILSAYGLTQIIVYGKLFNKIRPSKGRLGELVM